MDKFTTIFFEVIKTDFKTVTDPNKRFLNNPDP